MGKNHLIPGSQRVKLVFRRHKGQTRFLRDFRRGKRVKARRRVQPGADSRTAQGQRKQRFLRLPQQFFILFNAGPPAGNLLGEKDRRRVLQMGPAALERVPVFLFQPNQFFFQP